MRRHGAAGVRTVTRTPSHVRSSSRSAPTLRQSRASLLIDRYILLNVGLRDSRLIRVKPGEAILQYLRLDPGSPGDVPRRVRSETGANPLIDLGGDFGHFFRMRLVVQSKKLGF